MTPTPEISLSDTTALAAAVSVDAYNTLPPPPDPARVSQILMIGGFSCLGIALCAGIYLITYLFSTRGPRTQSEDATRQRVITFTATLSVTSVVMGILLLLLA